MIKLIVLILISLFLFLTYYINYRIKSLLSDKLTVKEIRTTEVFTHVDDGETLAIRYFYLESDEKSGDAILIKTPNGKNILIDSGKVATGEQLDHYLTQLSIEKIDYAIATHPHHDHIGGYLTVLKTKEIERVYMPNLSHTTSMYEEFIGIIEGRKIPITYLADGDKLTITDDLFFEVLNPPKGTCPENLPSNVTIPMMNNLSLVLKMTYKNCTFLFTADLYKDGERELLKRHNSKKLKSDFMDAPHHGAATSSTEELVNSVNAQYTVISANVLQSEKVFKQYQRRTKNLYITALHKNILLHSDGKAIKIIPEYDIV